ncbi:hypothetical protein GBA65_08380 [Rubrobacter marinus]|uniref:Uncharacterized protein n=1 Tax=Rubrobacter marinus TaxID=2653852 RepID=A0A6G8PWI2_9ACTN|nr:hypothetical protein [Rubrobacter marinus]QIN78535.1 hypothetical protein GBA65_08380 [Rubrobacter marinus]
MEKEQQQVTGGERVAENAGSRPGGPTVEEAGLGVRLLRVAWVAILLGFAMEAVLLLVATGFFGSIPSLGQLVADLLKNVSWSVVVCSGLALGQTISRIKVPAMGVLGLLAAPLAFEVARVLHKGTLQALVATGDASGGSAEVSPVLLALVKGIEYGCLGLAVAWIGGRPWGGLLAHVGVGLAAGVVFGGVILAMTSAAMPQPSGARLVPLAVNEVLFPVGCALVLFSAGALGQKLSGREQDAS